MLSDGYTASPELAVPNLPLQVLRLGNIVPDFEARTTMGDMHWHEWIEGSWAILFSHPADFTCALSLLSRWH